VRRNSIVRTEPAAGEQAPPSTVIVVVARDGRG
jgi:hypothetical protein